MRESADQKIDLYVETIDPNRFRGDAQQQLIRRYLRDRYADQPVAVVAAVYDRALAFLLDAHDQLFPGVPGVAVLSGQPQSLPAHVSVIWSGATFGESAPLALKLHPRTRQLALVDSALPGGGSDAVYDEARIQVERAAGSRTVIELRNLPLDELIGRVSVLPAETPIIVARQLIGHRGEPIATADAIRELAPAAPGPIYISSDRQIGSGAIGGMVVSVESEATRLGGLALRVARDATLRVSPAKGTPVAIFDWRQLQRWRVAESLLPPGSVVRFRELSTWEQYRVYILSATAVLGVQSARIVALAMEAARRRRTDVTLRQQEAALRTSFERNQDLAGRLIAAQETERTRIARDLHDDVSQQLAGVAIMLSGLKRSLPQADRQTIDDRLAALQERTTSVANAIRQLSHELHPGVLEHVGLLDALKRHCGEVGVDHRIAVTFESTDDVGELGAEAALCLYRVAQEALNNVIKHAHAGTAIVSLRETDSHVELAITDDGVEFVADERGAAGLGLRSIDERVRLIGGSVSVDSRPGHGTRLSVRVPILQACAPIALPVAHPHLP